MNRFSFITALTLVAGVAFAQAEPGIPQAADVIETAVVESGDATELLQNFINSKGWTEGINAKASGDFIVVVGTGVIAAPPDNKNYNRSRMLAFTKAMLDAKSNLSEFLEQSIASAAEFKATEHEPAEPTPEEKLAMTLTKMPDESICGKCVTLIHKKLDNALAAEGYSVDQARAQAVADYEAAKAKMDSVIASTSFAKAIASTSTSMISGLQSFYVVETKGEIGVVAIWSPALAEMAASMVTGQPVANKSPKKPILQQIPSDEATLLSTFGVQQKINEKGELVLVSYGQSAALTPSKQSQKNAKDQAKLFAQAQIREFAGEAVATSKSLEQAEQTLEFADSSTPEYSNSSAYESFQRTAAAAMKCNGIASIKSWKAVHPVSGKVVYGVVCTWSPSVAEKAREMKSKIESSARDGAMSNRKIPSRAPAKAAASTPAAKPSISSDDYINMGAAGDDDAF